MRHIIFFYCYLFKQITFDLCIWSETVFLQTGNGSLIRPGFFWIYSVWHWSQYGSVHSLFLLFWFCNGKPPSVHNIFTFTTALRQKTSPISLFLWIQPEKSQQTRDKIHSHSTFISAVDCQFILKAAWYILRGSASGYSMSTVWGCQ